MSLVGAAIGHIRVIGELARGGMGEVYVGLDETLQRRVALKAIRSERRLDPDAKARFLREARILSQLDHPHICRIYDYIEGGDADFLVLELIEGETLTASAARLDRATKLRVAQQVAGALAAAHERGIIHRDLKPGNVMLTGSGQVKVLDFGIAATLAPSPNPVGDSESQPNAALTAACFDSTAETFVSGGPSATTAGLRTQGGVLLGTGAYMSPEQARGEPLTPASDMYSFGLLIQELFTGQSPHPESVGSFEMVSRAARAESRPVIGLDAPLTALIHRLKQAAPSGRPTAVDVAERLQWIRNRRKRQLRLAVGIGVILLFVLGALKYTLDVRRARSEAERRRAQAEDLIGFMLGDLRAKLTAVGRLEVLDEAGAKALAYFDSLPAAAQTDDELVRRAKALSQIGEVRLAKGDSAGAASVLEESLSLAASVARRNPSRSEWQAALGVSHFWVGYAHWNKGDLDRAMTHLRAYHNIAEGLVAREPNRAEWQLELAQAQSNLGAVLQSRGENREAITHFQGAVDLKARLLAAAPEDAGAMRELAVTQSWLAEALQREGRLRQALDRFEANSALLQRLTAKDPANTEWRYLRAIGEGKIGYTLRTLGRREEALERFRVHLATAQSLTSHDPLNGDWRRELGNAHVAVAVELTALKRHDAAVRHVREGHRVLQALADSDPTSAEWRRMLANAENALATVALGRGAHVDALAAARRARAALAPLTPTRREDPQDARRLSESYLLEGRAYASTGRRQEATVAWTKALDLIAPAARHSTSADVLWPWATALMLLDRPAEARPIVQMLSAQGFRPADLAALCHQRGCDP